MASAANKDKAKIVPWYKEKYPRDRYLGNGDPESLRYEDLSRIQNWQEITEEKKKMWQDSKSVIDQRNKKRDYLVTYSEKPEVTNDGKLRMKIEMLSIDRRGFTYTAENDNLNKLQENFWPVIEWLIAFYFAPKLKMPPKVPLPEPDEDEEQKRERYFKDNVNRFMKA